MKRKPKAMAVVIDIIAITLIVWLGAGIISWARSNKEPVAQKATEQQGGEVATLTLPCAQVITSKSGGFELRVPVGEVRIETNDNFEETTP